MKTLLACALGAGALMLTGVAASVPTEASAQTTVVIKPNRGKIVVRQGYPYRYRGGYYRYRYSGRYYNHRAWRCHRNRLGERVCRYRYW